MKFGTDGIRGRAGPAPIDPESAVRIGRAAARLARENGSPVVVVARDTRPSGGMLAAAVCAGVMGEGGVAVDAGVVPTPALAVALHDGLGAAGVMITASHNPWVDNGFKILSEGGRKLTDDETARVEGWLAEDGHNGGVGYTEDAHQAVLEAWLARLADIDTSGLAGRRLAVDLAEGAGGVAADWLAQQPFEVVLVQGDRINDGVGSEHPGRLQQLVRDEGCFAGLAIDGDGDRCLLVDDTGEIVHGDALTWLLARRLGVDALAVTQMSTGALGPALPGVRMHVTPVGDRYLQIAMREHGLALAAEESGHVLFADHPGGDGLLAGLRALGGLERPLSAELEGFRPWPRVKAKVRVDERVPLDELPAVAAAVREGEERLGDGGRVFLRYSGTEPVMRILVEGRDDAVVEAVGRDVEAVIREVLCP
ncbi:MAG: phosphoglucosamine mutase [Alphaproteobacteria bacterium]|nr:phosphoglucosamine mutase [Alphaproteobacteria bacterium]MCB9690506.1 phosphoglucosamine mutase [Alphaproteobacteria bacterium]